MGELEVTLRVITMGEGDVERQLVELRPPTKFGIRQRNLILISTQIRSNILPHLKLRFSQLKLSSHLMSLFHLVLIKQSSFQNRV